MVEYINYKDNKTTIIKQLLNSNSNIPIDNDILLFDYYKFLHLVRHNYLHKMLLEMLNMPWSEEKTISSIFNFEMPMNIALKTPDIYFREKNVHYFIDVSVSYDTAKTEKNKYDKYNPIVIFLKEKNILSSFIHINLKNNYENLYKEIMKLDNIKKRDFSESDFTRMYNIIEDKKQWVNTHIDKTFFF